MEKFTFLLILNLSFIIFHSPTAKAQYVTIPDTAFVTWLTQNYPGCMSGNQMDTTCSGIVNEDSVDVSFQNLVSIAGVGYFDSLKYLKFHNNHIASLPHLPSRLQMLWCSQNYLTSLPQLHSPLTQLFCYGNQLTTLPQLPASLINLYCSGNQLTSIPQLPSSLKYLTCDYNPLTILPQLPNSLQSLRCSQNPLLSFPAVLPTSLRKLVCESNQFTSILSLPDSLQEFQCGWNQFTQLPQLPSQLQKLVCGVNQLTSLPQLPMSLKYLDCFGNQLTILPSLPINLQTLICNSNQLTNIPQLPNNLRSLQCGQNLLTSLPQLPDSLTTLYCFNNQLTNIPQVPSVMSSFNVSLNNISCIFNLPLINDTINGNISNNPLTCVPNQTWYSLGLPLCVFNDSVNNPNGCQGQGVVNITGNVYKDLNSNCAYDNIDLHSENIPVKLYDTQNNFLALSYTVNGAYSFTALTPDTFKVKIQDNTLLVSMACGQANNQSVVLDSVSQTISNINFPVVCDTMYDINVQSVNHIGFVHPGQMHTLYTNVGNNIIWYNLNCGSTNYSGTVTIQVAGPVTYVSAAPNALTPIVSGNTFTYNISDFNSITPTSFGLRLMTDTTAQAGNQICVHVSIASTPLDADTSNNEYDFCYNITNSYDPNMKEVYPIDVLPGYNDWFTYTIHFQNTGTAPAFNIRLRDTLDTQLDLNTFEFLGASHTATTSLNGRILSVRFNNIMLPDSTSDHDGSMGYYQYRVKPKANIINGSNIKNTAYIYFDYNPAIVTNTTENHFDMTVGKTVIARKNDEAISIYPNPVKDKLYYNNLPKNSTITIYNVLGEVCLTHHTSLPFGEVGAASLPNGVYFLKVNSQTIKFMKQ